MIVIYAIVIILTAVYTASYAVYEAKSKHYLSCAATVGVCIAEIALPVVMLILR